ncbi:MAG TPA: hypothetical protein VD995_30400 [Azospirillum sp.]|nr:hypothetical protein [Azospirillum sp.]
MPRPSALALVIVLSSATLPASAAEPQPACAPTVSAALTLWDSSMAAAERLGGRAVTLAREKGRELILPLLGVDPKSVAEQPGAADDVAREVEASRADPERRAALCAAITRAVEEAKDKAGAGLDALRRAVDGLRPAQQEPVKAPGNLIKT